MSADGSLDEGVAVGIERRQQRDIVGITLNKVCLCAYVCIVLGDVCRRDDVPSVCF